MAKCNLCCIWAKENVQKLDSRYFPFVYLCQSETLWRDAQEALANIERHAAARTVQIGLDMESQTARLTVKEDGRDMPPDAEKQPGHYGLRGMRERVEGLGGELTFISN